MFFHRSRSSSSAPGSCSALPGSGSIPVPGNDPCARLANLFIEHCGILRDERSSAHSGLFPKNASTALSRTARLRTSPSNGAFVEMSRGRDGSAWQPLAGIFGTGITFLRQREMRRCPFGTGRGEAAAPGPGFPSGIITRGSGVADIPGPFPPGIPGLTHRALIASHGRKRCSGLEVSARRG